MLVRGSVFVALVDVLSLIDSVVLRKEILLSDYRFRAKDEQSPIQYPDAILMFEYDTHPDCTAAIPTPACCMLEKCFARTLFRRRNSLSRPDRTTSLRILENYQKGTA